MAPWRLAFDGIHSCFAAPPCRSSALLRALGDPKIAHGGVRPTGAQ
jgi:hypothetical protein